MVLAIAPGLTDDYIKDGWTFEKKVHVFQNRVVGWQLKFAGDMALNNVPDRGFAQLMIVLSYFEMIARYHDGNLDDDKPGKWFMRGVRIVFKQFSADREHSLKEFYWRVRNGMYHMGMVRSNVVLSGEVHAAWVYHKDLIFINPDELVSVLIAHVVSYTAQIQKPDETELRDNFVRRFNYDNGIGNESKKVE
jgi:hypothetical protein